MTHDELTQAITAARIHDVQTHMQPDFAEEWNAHLDTLQAILDRHTPDHGYPQWCGVCKTGSFHAENVDWPCPDVEIVESALRNMGALGGGNK
jgi:hypothetical protein